MAGPNILDRVIGYFAPRAGLQRVAARQNMGYLAARGYDGASRRGRFEGWRAPNTAADAEVAMSLPILRGRMRDLVRNNPIAAKAVQVLTDQIVGTGIRPRAATGDKALDKRINELFERWSRRCDMDGRTDFYGLQALAVREMVEAGEVLAVRRRRPAAVRGQVPVEIEIRESEHLDEMCDGTRGSSTIRQGIEYDADGRRAAYWMYPEHPGSNQFLTNRPAQQSQRVPAEQVIHLFERQRVQNRGVPWGAPVMRSIREFDEWHEAELVRKRTEACLAGVVLDDDEPTPGINPREDKSGHVTDSSGELIEAFRPGMIAYSRGRDIKFNTPAASGGVYEWSQVQLHIMAAGFRVPYELMTGDLRQVNFSSSRVGLNSFRRMIEAMQWHLVIPVFCGPAWQWFVDAAYAAGEIDTRDVPVEWDPPRFESVNPLQDAQADLLEVRSGFMSLPQAIGKRGYDPRSLMREQSEALKEADALGLVLDSDPRRVAKSGAAQSSEPGQEPGTGRETE